MRPDEPLLLLSLAREKRGGGRARARRKSKQETWLKVFLIFFWEWSEESKSEREGKIFFLSSSTNFCCEQLSLSRFSSFLRFPLPPPRQDGLCPRHRRRAPVDERSRCRRSEGPRCPRRSVCFTRDRERK